MWSELQTLKYVVNHYVLPPSVEVVSSADGRLSRNGLIKIEPLYSTLWAVTRRLGWQRAQLFIYSGLRSASARCREETERESGRPLEDHSAPDGQAWYSSRGIYRVWG